MGTLDPPMCGGLAIGYSQHTCTDTSVSVSTAAAVVLYLLEDSAVWVV